MYEFFDILNLDKKTKRMIIFIKVYKQYSGTNTVYNNDRGLYNAHAELKLENKLSK